MPFLQVYWNPRAVDESVISSFRQPFLEQTADWFCRVDPEHIVTPAMIDARFDVIAPLDRFRSDVFITVLARWEPARESASRSMSVALADAARQLLGTDSVVVETVLTNHQSSFDYGSLE